MLCGDTGRCALELLEPMEVREGVDADVEAEIMDVGRDRRDPGENPVGLSTGMSSTSIESMKSRLLLKRLASISARARAPDHDTYREPIDIPFQAVHHGSPDGLSIRFALGYSRSDRDALLQFRPLWG